MGILFNGICVEVVNLC